MANKEFQVRHGLAVNNNVLVANTITGNVGIGTATPLAKLHVIGDAIFTGNVSFSGAAQIQSSFDSILNLNSSQANSTPALNDAGIYVNRGSLGNASIIWNEAIDRWDIRANSTNLVSVLSTGNFGIGTTAPANKLDVRGTLGVGQSSNTALNGFTLTSAIVGGDNHSATFAGPVHGTNDDVLFNLSRGGGAYGTFEVKFGGVSRLLIPGEYLRGDGYINLPTNSNFVFKNNNTERMRFDANGNLGIGTTSPFARLHVVGDSIFAGNVTIVGSSQTISSNTLSIGDSLIYLAANNYAGTDVVDIGFIANYGNSTGANVHTGLYRHNATKQYYLFQGYDIEPQANNVIVPYANNMVNAVLNADLATSNLTLGGTNAISWISSAFSKANNALANTSGISFNGSLNFPSGKVGISTSSIPAANLEVNATAIAMPNSVSTILSRGYDVNFAIMSSTGHAVNDPGSLVGRLGLRYLTDNSDSASLNFYRGGGSLDGSIGINTNGAERMRIDSGGNVGIGVTNTGGWKFRSHHTNNAAMMLYNTVGLGNRLYFVDQGWQSEIEGINGELKFKTGGTTNRMQIDAWGNVSIGSTASVAGLYVARYGSRTSSDSSTYYQPSGRVHLVVGNPEIGDGNGVDKWLAIVNGYGYTSGSVNILLQGNQNDINQQCGHYIGSEIGVGAHLSDLTFGRMVSSGSLSGRASKSEQMRITSGGDVMINQTSSAGTGKLGVAGRIAIDVNGSDSFSGQLYLTSPNGWPSNIQAAGPSSNGIAFWTYTGSWSERVRITGAGNVGIGNTNPQTRLHVKGSVNGDEDLLILEGAQTGTGVTGLLFKNSGGPAHSGAIRCGPTVQDPSGGRSLTFWGDVSGTLTERMRLDANGNFGLGVTSPKDNTKPVRFALSLTSNTVSSGIFIADNFAFAAKSTGGSHFSSAIASSTNFPGWSNYFAQTERYQSGNIADGSGFNYYSLSNPRTAGISQIGTYYSTIRSVQTSVSSIYGFVNLTYLQNTAASTGIITNAYGFHSKIQSAVGPTSTGSQYDFYADTYDNSDSNPSSIITNRYGVYLAYSNAYTTNAWGIYQVDANVKNYFAGSVGIGTNTPSYKLDVSAAVANGVRFDGARPITFNSNGLGEIRIKASSGGWSTGYLFSGSAGTDIGGFGAYGGSDSLTYHWVGSAYNTPTAVFTSGGNVGIGTTSPQTKLDVRGVIQGSSYTIPDTSGSYQWVKLGTFTAAQQGYTAHIRAYIHAGYNALNSQDFYVDIFFKTSNGASVDSNGFAGNSWYYGTGFQLHSIGPKWVGNAAGASATSYDLYLYLPSFTLRSHYKVEIPDGATWTHTGTIGQTDPGSSSNTVCISSAGYNILYGNVGIGTTTATAALTVATGDIMTTVDAAAKIGWNRSGKYFNWIECDGVGGNNYMRFATGNAEALRIDSSGNVGIGTSSPVGKLSVVGNILAPTFNSNTSYTIGIQDAQVNSFVNSKRGSLIIQSSSATSGAQAMGGGDLTLKAGNSYSSQFDTEGDVNIISGYNTLNTSLTRGKIRFITNNTESMRIDANGNIGIGTTSPLSKLHVYGSQFTSIRVETNSTQASLALYDGDTSSSSTRNWAITSNKHDFGDMAITTSNTRGGDPIGAGTTRLCISNAGNIGIGTTSPQTKLEVSDNNANGGGIRVSNPSVSSQYLSLFMMGPSGFGVTGWANSAVIEAVASSAASGDRALYLSAYSGPVILSTNGRNERMRITSNGNIGIGTSIPIEYDSNSISMTIQGPNFASINLRDAASSTRTELGAGSTESFLKSVSNLPFTFYTNNTERMRIGATGRVAIGMTDTTNYGKLGVAGTGTTSPSNNTNLLASSIFLYDDNGSTTGSTSGIFNKKATGGLGSGIGFIRESASTWGTAIAFYNHPSPTTNLDDLTERMRITGDGNVGIGITAPAAPLHVNSAIFTIASTTASGRIWLREVGASATANTIELHLRPNAGKSAYLTFTEDTIDDRWSIGVQNGSGVLRFISGTPSGTERMRIDAGGNVAIGQATSPSRLTVQTSSFGDSGGVNGNVPVYLKTYAGTSTSTRNLLYSHLYTGSATDFSNLQLVFENSNSTTGRYGSIVYTSDLAIAFRTGATSVSADSLVGSERMRIDANGNIGIGTTTPATSRGITLNNAANYFGINFQVAGSNIGQFIQEATGSIYFDVNMQNNPAGAHVFRNNSIERMRIDANGNIGIGTTSITQDISGSERVLQVANTNAASLYLHSTNGNKWQISSITGGSLSFYNNAVQRMTVDSSGNVAIGQSSTTYKLQVNGSFAAATKSFVIDHPTKPGMKLRHGSLEGPENGVYVRGKTKEKVIELPEYWRGLVDSSTITVQLTAIGRSQNLYVVDVSDNRVHIDSENYTDVDCYYYIQAERKDVEKLVVEY